MKRKYFIFIFLAILACTGIYLRTLKKAKIFRCIERSNIEELENYLNKNGSVNIMDSNGRTPLHLVARLPLLQKLYSQNQRRNNYVYDEQSNLKIAKLLISNGAKLNLMDSVGLTPLMLAIEANNLGVAKLLIDSGSNINIPSPTYGSALHLAVHFVNLRATRLLVEKNANVNLQEYLEGSTPLHDAVVSGDSNIVLFLIESGANQNIKDKRGMTPLDLAMKYSDEDIIKILSK